MKHKVELLAPCGSFECVRAAVNAGADAVYLGGRLFSARAYANNFTIEEIGQTCDYCHVYGVKVYVTVNTLYRNDELEPLLKYIDDLYAVGVDALIMQDLGAISLVRKHWPDLPVHISTQLTTNSLADVRTMEELGASTVVLSRELTLDEIRHICSNSSARVEVFIHGALCVSYSGQCLMGSILANRSGNRGRCSQNCRMNYSLYDEDDLKEKGYLLSTKDICTLDELKDLVAAGVSSLKIEGRMKSPEYVYLTVSIYRHYLDLIEAGKDIEVAEKDIRDLRTMFNRGGFSGGYLNSYGGRDMMCTIHPGNWGEKIGEVVSYDGRRGLVTIRTQSALDPGDGIEVWTNNEKGVGCYINRKLLPGENTIPLKGDVKKSQSVYCTYKKELHDRIQRDMLKKRMQKMTGKIVIRSGQPVKLTVSALGRTVEVSGEIPSAAQNQPLSEEFVREQISRLGNTVFELERLGVVLEEGLYLNRSELNRIKNEAAEKLQKEIVSSAHRESMYPELTKPEKSLGKPVELAVCTGDIRQFEAACSNSNVVIIYVEPAVLRQQKAEKLLEMGHAAGKKVYLKLPRIIRKHNEERIRGIIDENDFDGYLISSFGQLELVRGRNRPVAADHTANIINSCAAEAWLKEGIQSYSPSVEASAEDIANMPEPDRREVLVYGLIPLMITSQCPIGNYLGARNGRLYCRERYADKTRRLSGEKDRFVLKPNCDDCTCTIYTDRPLKLTDISDLAAERLRIDLVNETAGETAAVLNMYSDLLSGKTVDNKPQYGFIYHRELQ